MMKRSIALLLAFLGLCATAAAQEAAVFVRAPLYDAPEANAQEIMRYHIGTRVEVIREADAQYVQVNVGEAGGSLMGYMEKRDLEFDEAAIRAFQAERVTCRGAETQTCTLYSYPDKAAPILDGAFNVSARQVLGVKDGQWLHVQEIDGATGFVARDELTDESLYYDAAPYIHTQPMESELSREAALEEAKARLKEKKTDLDMERLERCTMEMDILFYYELPDQLTYTIDFRDPETGYIYTGVSFLVKGKEIVKVSFGNG